MRSRRSTALCRALVVLARPCASTLPQQMPSVQPALNRPLRPHPVHRIHRIFRYRQLRSTALDVAPISRSSRNTRAFSSPGDSSFFSTARSRPDRRSRARNAAEAAGRGHPASPIEQPVDLLHQLAQAAELRPAAGDPPQGRPLGGVQAPADEEVAVVEQLADLPLDRLLAPGRSSRRLGAGDGPRQHDFERRGGQPLPLLRPRPRGPPWSPRG